MTKSTLILMLTILIPYAFIALSNCRLTRLDVTPAQLPINGISIYTWSFNYNNSVSRQTFTLNFPSCVTIFSNTTVSYVGGSAVSIANFTISSITFNISPAVSSSSYTFNIQNVKNCFHAGGSRNFSVFNNADGVNQFFNTMNIFYYRQGTVSNCQPNFEGTTGNTSSKLSTRFKIENPVVGSVFCIKLYYPIYFSSTWTLTSFNTPTCQLLTNGNIINSPVSATLNPDQSLSCSITLLNGTVIIPTDNIQLILINITNPVTSTMYATNTDFSISTYDMNGNLYDRSAFCVLNPVPIAQYTGNFTQTTYINSVLSPLQIFTTSNIPIRIAMNDQLLVQYNLGLVDSCSTRIFVDKSLGSSPITFVLQQPTLSQTLIFISNGSSILNNPITIQFTNCLLNMPTSTLNINFTLIFSAATTTAGVYDNYMQFNAQIMPLFYPMASSQVGLQLSDSAIGQISSYTINITLTQGLSQTPSITIDFPTQINIASASTTLSSCNIAINNNGIGSKNCQFLAPNSVQINITNTVPLVSGNLIQITIPNFRNPYIPSSVFNGFNIKTHFTSAQLQGLVEVGNNIISTFPYIARTIYPQIPSNNFTVYTPNTSFIVQYQFGVNLSAGSIVNFTFNNVLNNLAYLSANKTGITVNQNSTSQFRLNLPSIVPGQIISFNFQCLTPNRTGIYDVLSIQTVFSGSIYQKTVNLVTFEVTQPFTNPFNMGSSRNMTGQLSNYTFFFTSLVPLPKVIALQITFPAGTTLTNGFSICSNGCVSTNLTDTSSGLINRYLLFLQNFTCNSSCSYSVIITLVKNQRQVGSTGFFLFKVMTNDLSQSILYGQSQTTITSYNNLNASLDQSDDYFKNNTNPVRFTINVTNSLQVGDFVFVRFTSSSYSLNGGTISCASAISCNAVLTNGNVNTQAKIMLSATQVIQNKIDLSIFGLISSSLSVYGQAPVPINVSTYTSSGHIIDSGLMYYILDCAQNNTIISKHCKTCGVISGQYVCTSCYPIQFLYNNTLCTTSCSISSNFLNYNGSGTCVPCQPPCYTCFDQINCASCINGFYLLYQQQICIPSCNTSAGYFVKSSSINSSWAQCIPCTAPNCISCPNDVCNACRSNSVLMNGSCVGGCSNGTYNSGGTCKNCHTSCLTCDGPFNTNCFECAANNYPDNGACTSNCPYGKVLNSSGLCSCSGNCATCVTTLTKCLSCLDTNYFIYNFTCYIQCPPTTYALGKQCVSCSSGCYNCTSTTCIQCNNNYNIFQNKCYQDCKQIGPSYSSMQANGIYRCKKCPDGCSQCNNDFECSSCLQNYQLNGTVCKRICEFTNTCNVLVTVQPVLPLPGLITFGIFTIAIVLLKILLLKDIYVPYTLLFGAALVQFILLVASLGSLDIKIKSGATARLLQVSMDSSTFYTTQGILAASVFLNYLMNIVSIWIFCKYIKPLILPRQIDIISNYITFAIGVLTNYRFYLLAFCKLVKKPSLQIKGPQKLKNLHIVLGVSYLLDIVAFVAAIILLMNTSKLGVMSMLSLDLILIILFSWVIFIWVLVRPKSDNYYSETKKYSLQQNHITQQGSIQNNQKQISKVKLQNGTNQKIQVQQYADENVQNVDDLPTQQQNFIKIKQKNAQQIQQGSGINNPKTKRKQKNQQFSNVSSEKKFLNSSSHKNQKLVQNSKYSERNKNPATQQKNSDRVRSTRIQNPMKIHKHQRNQSQSLINGINKAKKQQIYQFEDTDHNQTELNQAAMVQKPVKYKPGTKSTTLKIDQHASVMKKKDKYGSFQSEIADSNVDELDLQTIIQTRVIDRTKDKKAQRDARTQVDKNQKNLHIQQISPSWFNIQNQRYDIDDKQLE